MGTVAGIGVLAIVVTLTTSGGYRTHSVHAEPGGAWFASDDVGLVTLIDGATAQASAFTRPAAVARTLSFGTRDTLQVAQLGTNAYVTDERTGLSGHVSSQVPCQVHGYSGTFMKPRDQLSFTFG